MTSLQLLKHSLELQSPQYQYHPQPAIICIPSDRSTNDAIHAIYRWQLSISQQSCLRTGFLARPFSTLITPASWWRRPPLPPLVAQRLSGPTQGAQDFLHLPPQEHPVQKNHHLDGKLHQKWLSTFSPTIPIHEKWFCSTNLLLVSYKSNIYHLWKLFSFYIFSKKMRKKRKEYLGALKKYS